MPGSEGGGRDVGEDNNVIGGGRGGGGGGQLGVGSVVYCVLAGGCRDEPGVGGGGVAGRDGGYASGCGEGYSVIPP